MNLLVMLRDMMRSLFAKLMFGLLGWKITGSKTEHLKEIIIAAPHTSGWDYIILLGASWIYRYRVSWIGKKELFKFWPLGVFFKITGGIPVDRGKSNNMVNKIAEQFAMHDELHICVPPEGSRSKRPGWKTGFYYMALAAKVPITCSSIDYSTKTVDVGPSLIPSGDIDKDMQFFKEYYKDIKGKYPELQSPVELIKT